MNATEKRRSERLMLTLPLYAQGLDAQGRPFQSPAHTINVNRFGARIRIFQPLRDGQAIKLGNAIGHQEAEFRVVQALSPTTEKGGHYGVECLNEEANIWRIEFPSSGDGEAFDAKALLECQICHTVALVNLTPGEFEALRTLGVVAKHCQTCLDIMPAKYAELSLPSKFPTEAGWTSALARLVKARRHRRIYLQLPLGIRTNDSNIEITRTENVSKDGYCFTSKKNYPVGEAVFVVYPGEPLGHQREVLVRIIWQQAMEGSPCKVYGAHREYPGI